MSQRLPDYDAMRAREKGQEVIIHGMLPGSHEHGGPECRCGAPWSKWQDMCLVQFRANGLRAR